MKPKKTILDECKNIIDILSLIPPEYLQDEVEGEDENNGDSAGVDNDQMKVDNQENTEYGNITHENITATSNT